MGFGLALANLQGLPRFGCAAASVASGSSSQRPKGTTCSTGLSGSTVFTNAHKDNGISYAADGSILSRAVFRATEHTTITPDGRVRVSCERGRLTCS